MEGGLRTMSGTSRVVCSLVLLFHILVLEAASGVGASSDSSSIPCPKPDPRMDPTYELRHGTHFVWQIPPNPRAIFSIFHGGGMDELEFFDPAPKCRQCVGLPESRAIVLEALRRGYAVIAVKSLEDRWNVTWPVDESKDLAMVTTVIKEWTREHVEILDGLPLVAWGHSAGSYVGSALSVNLQLRGLVLQCGEGVIEVLERATPERFPPTFFAYMPKDADYPNLDSTNKDIKSMAILKERGAKVAEKQLLEKPLSPLFFTERIRCMSEEMSRNVFQALEAAEWLDSEGYLTRDPVENDWRSVLQKANALPFCEESGDLCLAAHVQQELKMAFALHSITGDAMGEFFPWLDSIAFPSEIAGGELDFLSASALVAEI